MAYTSSFRFVLPLFIQSFSRIIPFFAGIPHSTTSPDVYNDYHIPQNAMVIPNIWYAALLSEPNHNYRMVDV